MIASFLMDRFTRFDSLPSFVWQDKTYSYAWLVQQAAQMKLQLQQEGIAGNVVSLEEDYSPYAVAALLALFEQDCIVIPIDRKLVEAKKLEYLDIGEAERRIQAGENGLQIRSHRERPPEHPLLISLLQEEVGGLVIFSSGSTGKSKAAVHRLDRLLHKFQTEGRAKRTIPFMMFDHIGGMNTLLHTLRMGAVYIFWKTDPRRRYARRSSNTALRRCPYRQPFLIYCC